MTALTPTFAHSGKLGLAALDAGIIEDRDIATGRTPTAILHAAFQRLVSEAGVTAGFMQKGDLVLDPRELCSDICYELDEDQSILAVSTASKPCVRIVKPMLSELEYEFTGLGSTLLYALEFGLHIPAGCFGPNAALDAVQDLHWGGHENETEFFEEWQEDPSNYEEMVTRADFDADIPPWMTTLPTDCDRTDILDAAIRNGGQIAELALIATSIFSLLRDNHSCGERVFFRQIDHPFIIRAHGSDETPRIFDDSTNQKYEYGDALDNLNVWKLPLDPQKLGDVAATIRREAHILRLSLQLLDAITDIDHEYDD